MSGGGFFFESKKIRKQKMNENFLGKFVFFFVMSSLIIASRVHTHPNIHMWGHSGKFRWRKKIYRHTCTTEENEWMRAT